MAEQLPKTAKAEQAPPEETESVAETPTERVGSLAIDAKQMARDGVMYSATHKKGMGLERAYKMLDSWGIKR